MNAARLYVIWFAIMVALAMLLAGLWRIQVKKGEYFLTLSRDNRIKHVSLEAPRGSVYDRFHRVLVSNRPSFDIMFVAQELKKFPQIVVQLANIMETDAQTIWDKIARSRHPAFLPDRLFRDIPKDKVSIIEEQSLHLPGIFVSVQPKRKYVQGDLAGHVLGYVGEINREELDAMRPYGYVLGDVIGKDGLERVYEPYLKGTKGGRQIEVNALGHPKQELGYKAPQKGHDLVTTLDLDIQEIVDRSMKGKKGAVVVMDPKSGGVLAMVSKPGFDPNLFVEPSRYSELKTLLNDRGNRPLLNRAIGAAYPPGSVFKVFMGLIGLKEKKISGATEFHCSGSYRIGRLFHCWYEYGHGDVHLPKALRTSCNVFFYRMSQMIPIDTIVEYTKYFGFGQATGVDLLHEKSGFVPSRAWKQRTFNQRWYPGETANYSIGQGYLLVTPLQLLSSVNIVANNGLWIQPHLVSRIEDGQDASFEAIEPRRKKFDFTDAQLRVVRLGMKEVVNDPRGTGQRAYLPEVAVAGKTGTVQVVGKAKKEAMGANVPEKYRNHAWFAGFAPYDDPQVSIVVFLEHGESGGRYAAEVAHDILNDVFALKTYGAKTVALKDQKEAEREAA